jgi:hypothetical protein
MMAKARRVITLLAQERAASPDQRTRGPFLLNNVERVHETMPQEPEDSEWYDDDELWLRF